MNDKLNLTNSEVIVAIMANLRVATEVICLLIFALFWLVKIGQTQHANTEAAGYTIYMFALAMYS